MIVLLIIRVRSRQYRHPLSITEDGKGNLGITLKRMGYSRTRGATNINGLLQNPAVYISF
jgi:hypothetical protein